jgi:hypothetical protein
MGADFTMAVAVHWRYSRPTAGGIPDKHDADDPDIPESYNAHKK